MHPPITPPAMQERVPHWQTLNWSHGYPVRLRQIDSVFPVKGWLGFRPIFKKKKTTKKQQNFKKTHYLPFIFSWGSFFLGWLARFSDDEIWRSLSINLHFFSIYL